MPNITCYKILILLIRNLRSWNMDENFSRYSLETKKRATPNNLFNHFFLSCVLKLLHYFLTFYTVV